MMGARRAIVLGAGIQGICSAFALRKAGYAVTIVDGSPDCMLHASSRNEGKIHLGFVYANDPTFRTPAILLNAALNFAPCLENWFGPIDWRRFRAAPFTYLVLNDSILSSEQLLQHYARLQERYHEEIRDPRLHYLGLRPECIFRPLSPAERSPLLNPARAVLAVETAEAALDIHGFRAWMRERLHAAADIERLYRHRVAAVQRTSGGFRVEGAVADAGSWSREADLVVNCLWAGRLVIDAQMGLTPTRKWAFRLKHRILGELPARLEALPSLTMVLGPFGDIVVRPGRETYLSWYPACLRGWSADLAPPASWKEACEGDETDLTPERLAIARESLEGFESIVPGIIGTRVRQVAGGVIFSWGESDIDDPGSELHRRYDIGLHEHDGYYSIDTGKFTTAPLFAQHLADRLR